MGASYQLNYRNFSGTQIASLSNFLSMRMRRVVNGVGELELTLPYNVISGLGVRVDDLIEVYRSPGTGLGMLLEGETVWLVRSWTKSVDSDGYQSLTIAALDAIDLLKRRIVAYPAESSQAQKTDQVDDMMKEIVAENFGSSVTDTLRNVAAYISIDPNLTAAPSMSKAFSRRNILTVFQELAEASCVAGTYLAFDLVRDFSKGMGFTFRTYTQQRGTDHRASAPIPVIFDPLNFSVIEVTKEMNYMEMKNSIYAGGMGEKDARLIGTAKDTDSISLSGLNLVEFFQDAINAATQSAVDTEAKATLREHRAQRTFVARQMDTSSLMYDRDYKFGDYVTSVVDDDILDVRLSAVDINVQNGLEQVVVLMRTDA